MLRAYFKQISGSLIYLMLCCGILMAMLALLGLPFLPAVYCLGLCALAGVPFVLCSFLHFRQKHTLLSRLEFEDTLPRLPAPSQPLEKDYQALLHQLYTLRQQDQSASEQRYENTLYYFTMWTHQIKTPIAGMDLILQTEGTPDRSELKGLLSEIQRYVSMALSYLRLGSKTNDFVLRSCALDPIVRSAIHSFAGQFIRQKTKLNYTPADCTVLTDEKWLQFVIEQLLSNALKYAPGGSVTIAAEQNTLLISDNGIGIAPEDLPRIFENGYTGCNGRQTRHTTGIGLYLCREILRQLGHTIEVESTPGEGTTVRLFLARQALELD